MNFNVRSIFRFTILAGTLAPAILLTATAQSAVTAAFSETSPDYQRVLLPSGRYEQETYAFAQGKLLDQSDRDESLNSLSFREIGSILATALVEADYVPTPSSDETDLLIVVHWGKTVPWSFGASGLATESIIDAFDVMKNSNDLGFPQGEFGNYDPDANPLGSSGHSMSGVIAGQFDQGIMTQQMADDVRYESIAFNARLLGYHRAVGRARDLAQYITMFRDRQLDVVKEIETPRFFVILQAYDFQKLWKQKERKLLWTTRFSIRAYRNRFDEQLESMALAASRVIGKDSGGLVRKLKASRVEFGELEYLGIDEDK